VLEERILSDATGAAWRIQVPTIVDPRIAALLEAHREAEMYQVALRGRPLEHPDTQITILSSLPLPGLAPTIICAAPTTPRSNAGRERATIDRLLAAVQQLLSQGRRVLDAPMIAKHAGVSVVTVRKHWETIASRLHLRAQTPPSPPDAQGRPAHSHTGRASTARAAGAAKQHYDTDRADIASACASNERSGL
jgi:hypothetical protein